MPAHTRIQTFLNAVRARMERARLARIVSAVFFVMSVWLATWCLLWILQGYAVPKYGYLQAAFGIALFSALAWWMGRTNERKAARFADDHFGLKDALSSHLGFQEQHREGDFIALQVEDTARRIESCEPANIPIRWSRRFLTWGAILLVSSLVMGFKKPSPIVMERLSLEQETSAKTEEINKELQKQIEELLTQSPEDERELLQPEEWKKWLEELRQTKDQKAALRQYAELERRITEAAQKLSLRSQEQLLAKAAAELSQEAPLRPMAKALEQKDYKQAAEQLRKMQPKADDQKPDEARQELARLKSAAQRMAAAARSYQQRSGQNSSQKSGSQSQSQNNASTSPKSSQSGQQAQGSQGSSSNESMDQQMISLEQQVNQLEQHMQQNPSSSECKNSQSQVHQQIAKLSQSLCRSAAQCNAAKKLTSLSQCTSKCQSYLSNKQCNSLSQSLGQKTGKGIGAGSSESRRTESELSQDNGKRDQLQGQKGAGPSSTSIEAADSGSGTVSRQASHQERTWQRQVESFVQREDVPAEVKAGVKEYFKAIQQVGEEQPAQPASN